MARDIIVVGSSAGGVEALQKFCASLPADLPAAIFVAQHMAPSGRSMLAHLLNKAGPLRALSPVEGQAIERGHIYVAVPDFHMLIRPGRILMRRGPHENRTRPAVDALFRSAAVHYGGSVIGIVLTGLLDDGTEGLIAIKAGGGVSIVQDPAEAAWPSMPRNALKRDHVDHVLPVAEIGALLGQLTSEDAPSSIPVPEEYHVEDRIAAQEFAVAEPDIETPGTPSHISCPDCGGVLNAIEGEQRFRCQVGHAYTPLALSVAQNEELERALGIAVRTHRDRIKLFDQMFASARQRGFVHAQKRWADATQDSQGMIEVLEAAMASLRKPIVEGEA